MLNGLSEMDFEQYQAAAHRTAVYPGQGTFIGLCYATLGANGEAGEVAEQVKKAWRNDGNITPEREAKIVDELGDTLWYCAQVATELGLNLQDIAEANVQKLAKRMEAGTLKVHD